MNFITEIKMLLNETYNNKPNFYYDINKDDELNELNECFITIEIIKLNSRLNEYKNKKTFFSDLFDK